MRLGRGSRHLQFERLHQILKVFVFLYQQAIGFLSTIDLSLLFLLDDAQVEYRCTCSKDRVTKALIATGKDGLSEMAQDDTTEVVCNFCNKKYHFSKEEIKKLMNT